VRISQILNIDKYKEYEAFTGEKEYIMTLPLRKGEYIFNVFAEWDANNHNTATIFRVGIE
jgi:hypothetical protein